MTQCKNCEKLKKYLITELEKQPTMLVVDGNGLDSMLYDLLKRRGHITRKNIADTLKTWRKGTL